MEETGTLIDIAYIPEETQRIIYDYFQGVPNGVYMEWKRDEYGEFKGKRLLIDDWIEENVKDKSKRILIYIWW